MKKGTKTKAYIIIAAAAIVSLIVEVLFAHPHGSYPWHTIPGADIVIAFVGAWILIILAKVILAPIIQRSEDYYDGGDDNE